MVGREAGKEKSVEWFCSGDCNQCECERYGEEIETDLAGNGGGVFVVFCGKLLGNDGNEDVAERAGEDGGEGDGRGEGGDKGVHIAGGAEEFGQGELGGEL